jgi:excinuclease UvrABC ATPase subunit
MTPRKVDPKRILFEEQGGRCATCAGEREIDRLEAPL